MPVKRAKAIDKQIGALISARRRMQQMSQSELGEKIGVTFQQVQKYEKGSNRVSGGRLILIAQVLGVEPGYFLGTDGHRSKSDMQHDILIGSPDGARLFHAFAKLPDGMRRLLASIAQTMAQEVK